MSVFVHIMSMNSVQDLFLSLPYLQAHITVLDAVLHELKLWTGYHASVIAEFK